jgi:peptide subunit release factor 1 (eRF1)
MISTDDLNNLMQYEPTPNSPVLSVYLDTDQTKEANSQRGFEVVLKNMLREVEQHLDKDKKKEFSPDKERVLRYVEEYREPARGLVAFCDESEGFLWLRELRVSVRNGLWWNDLPHLRPLIETVDKYERYGVVLADREHARLFIVFLREIEEHREAFAEADVTHIKGPGTEHSWSQMQIQRKADEHAHWHLKNVADLMSRLASRFEFGRLILAGPVEATSELQSLLPKSLRTRVVGRINVPVDAPEDQVLEETLKIEDEIERAHEAELVESLITAANKNRRGVLGLDATLEALQEWRIMQLVYSHGFVAPRGSQCTNCGALFAEVKDACSFCGKPVNAIDDLLDRAATRTLEMRAKVDEVYGPAAARLLNYGSIGAMLRF